MALLLYKKKPIHEKNRYRIRLVQRIAPIHGDCRPGGKSHPGGISGMPDRKSRNRRRRRRNGRSSCLRHGRGVLHGACKRPADAASGCPLRNCRQRQNRRHRTVGRRRTAAAAARRTEPRAHHDLRNRADDSRRIAARLPPDSRRDRRQRHERRRDGLADGPGIPVFR